MSACLRWLRTFSWGRATGPDEASGLSSIRWRRRWSCKQHWTPSESGGTLRARGCN